MSSEYEQNIFLWKEEDEIISKIKNKQVILISGGPGCGKSIQIPHMIIKNLNFEKKLGISQPREPPVISYSNTLSTTYQYAVSYEISNETKTCCKSKIDIFTEEILLKKLKNDNLLEEYSILILDEVHHRSIELDLIIGILKKTLNKRTDLKLIFISFSFDISLLLQYFENNLEIVEISNSIKENVEISFLPSENMSQNKFIINQVKEILEQNLSGDILIIHPVIKAINNFCELIKQFADTEKNIVLPFHKLVPDTEKLKIIGVQEEDLRRKIIISSNIGELFSLKNLVYIIDSGKHFFSEYDRIKKKWSRKLKNITKSIALQRSSLVGRFRKGKCIRAYSEITYNKFDNFSPPKILINNLDYMFFNLVSMDYDPFNFDYLTAPPDQNLYSSCEKLTNLNLIENKDKRYLLTKYGQRVRNLPFNYEKNVVLLKAEELGCANEILLLFSLVKEYVLTEDSSLNEKYEKILDSEKGELTRLLNIHHLYTITEDKEEIIKNLALKSNSIENANLFKDKNFIQLSENDILKFNTLSFDTSSENYVEKINSINASLICGFFNNIAVYDPECKFYRDLRSFKKLNLTQYSSNFFKTPPEFLIYLKKYEDDKTEDIYISYLQPIAEELIIKNIFPLNSNLINNFFLITSRD